MKNKEKKQNSPNAFCKESACCVDSGFEDSESDQNSQILENPNRRKIFKYTAAGVAGLALSPAIRKGPLAADSVQKIKLAFCGQLLCVVPYEVAVKYGHFRKQGLDVELIYTRGGGNAIRALIGDSVEFAASSFDAALGAYKKTPKIERVMTTGQLPLFALATSPKTRESVKSLKDLEGKKVGISKPANADHALLLYLLAKAGADSSKVEFINLGTNLYEALRLGYVDAGMVQEPALSLLQEKGSGVLANFMDLEQTKKFFGGSYEFMGVSVLKERTEERKDLILRLAKGLTGGSKDTRTLPIQKVIEAIPKQLIASGDTNLFEKVLQKYRKSLYVENVKINPKACQRVVEAHIAAGNLKQDFDVSGLLNQKVLGA